MRTQPSLWRLIAASAVLSTWIAGCGDGPSGPGEENPGLAECQARNRFDARDFTQPTQIDSRYFPLVPGTQYILDGIANRGGGPLPHRVIFTVTDLVKEIDGVDALCVYDRDYNEQILAEAELAFFAQDDDGNVWTMGEYPEEYSNGEFIGAPSTWISGLSGADAGLLCPGVMLTSNFLQGWAPDVNFLDCGRIFMVNQSTCVPLNCYENVLVVDEWSPLEPGSGHQQKYYAPGVGNVRIGAIDDPEGETLVLVNILHLTPEQMAEVRRETLQLEARAYEINHIYRQTPRMKVAR